MALPHILPFAKDILQLAVGAGDIVVDGTMGNGHDTLFLANLVGKDGHVFAFDIQKQALAKTTERLEKANVLHRTSLLLKSHGDLLTAIPEKHHGQVAGAIFNLGYLPGGDKNIVTKPDSTLQAIASLLEILKPGGVIVLVVYFGHEEGKVERDALLKYLNSLDQNIAHVAQYGFINQKNHPPFVLAVEKK